MEIIKNFENKLLRRKQVIAKTEVSDKTISRKETKAQLAKLLKVKEDSIIIKEIKSHFGSKEVIIEANVYANNEELQKTARSHLIKRNTFEEKKVEGSE